MRKALNAKRKRVLVLALWLGKAKFHYAILLANHLDQVAHQVCDLFADLVCDLDSVMECRHYSVLRFGG